MNEAPLLVIHIVRKMFQGTVSENIIQYGTGGLNIDLSRSGTGPSPSVSRRTNAAPGVSYGGSGWVTPARPASYNEQRAGEMLGRWPSNVALQHLSLCVPRDLKKNEKAPQPLFSCHPSCPCFDLDFQGVKGMGVADVAGGPTQYYKQVQTMTASTPEIFEYLRVMISPPPPFQPAEVLEAWPEWADTAEPASHTGFVIFGWTPTETQVARLYEILVPGGHLCLAAPETQPTGHSGAILLEDGGFEIRDAFLWVRGPGRAHYVPKASRSERELGCHAMPQVTGKDAVDREEGTAGLNSPRAGAGRTAKFVQNHHPTVKAVGIMTKLLLDIPTDQGPILDPFLGSGTTLVACTQTGHSAIGIEREEPYLRIADARVRYWDRSFQGWLGAVIESDIPQEKASTEQISVEDMFGF